MNCNASEDTILTFWARASTVSLSGEFILGQLGEAALQSPDTSIRGPRVLPLANNFGGSMGWVGVHVSCENAF